MNINEQEKINLNFQLQHFIIDARQDSNLKNLSTMQELCTCLATTERSFSAMKIIKNKLRNKMEAKFLASTVIIYIERDIATNFSSDSIIENFKSLKKRKGAL